MSLTLARFRPLRGKRIALLEASGVEGVQLACLKEAFELAGAEVLLVVPNRDLRPTGGVTVRIDARVLDTAPDLYHALCIPGSPAAIAALCNSTQAREFALSFAERGKWIAALDYGPLLLAEIGITSGKTLTSDPSLRGKLERAGATWVPEPVVVDQRLITARGSAQLEAFVRMASFSFSDARGAQPTPGQ